MAEWRGTSSSPPLRAKSARFSWLLLFWWTHVTHWLGHWLKVWVQRPLMRLGIGAAEDVQEVENEAGDAATETSSAQQQETTLPCGLSNNGNMCFVNAVLQCLAANPSFLESVDRALRMRAQLHVTRQPDDAHVQKLLVTETLVSLLRGISPVESEEMEVEARGAASRQEQQDAEEFLSFLLELLHELLRCPAEPEYRKDEERHQFLQVEKRVLNKLKGYDPNDPRSYTHAVEQRIISLTITSGKGDKTLAECLEHFRHPEQLTGENRVYCDGYCQAKTTRLTQILLQRVPPVLVLRLQRFKHTSFRGYTEKVDTAVSFPCGSDEFLDLTMNSFFRDDEKRVKFQLVAFPGE
uniref:USP domain-containing protein n=1 Tax=Phytophthora ramorum TaxID=164328 RepID=H3HBS9_PHYRM